MNAALHIISMYFKGFIRFLRTALAREIVVFTCGLVITSLFYYIFSDFLNEKIAPISLHLKQRLGTYFALVLLLWTSVRAGVTSKRMIRNRGQVIPFADSLGEDPHVLRYTSLGIFLTVITVYYGISWTLLIWKMIAWHMTEIAISCVAMVTISGFFLTSRPDKESNPKTKPTNLWYCRDLSAWLLKSILGKHRSATLGVWAGLFCSLVVGTMMSADIPSIVHFFLAMGSGCLSALGLVFLLCDWIQVNHLEFSAGLSHEKVMSSVEKLTALIAISIALCFLLGYISSYVIGTPKVAGSEIIKITVAAMVPILIVPYQWFQIDAQKAGVQWIVIILAALFLGTAIYAHLASLILLPFVRYYGLSSQIDRFYRA